MGKIKKKGESGIATNYITRNRAVKKLQLSLADFRRLCILKGIYPREPKNKKKANRGSTAPTTFYYTKDIQYLAHEPILRKLRENKIFLRKLSKALGKRQFSVANNLEKNRPVYTLDHIIKERYPTFTDALRDLDDALCMIFLFGTYPATDKIKVEIVRNCQRLCSEFQQYVIKSKCLRKVFLSIKGIYYQVEIKGQTITWLVPYQFSQRVPDDVDFRVMLTFLEFYQTLVSFVNFKLYSDTNSVYPPKIDLLKDEEDITTNEEIEALDEFVDQTKTNSNSQKEKNDDDTKVFTYQTVSAAITELQQLFSKCVFYLSREVPKYSLEFIIKAFGGKVGWDSSMGMGSPYEENYERITHQIVDRPSVDNCYPTRVYVQPQWVYDCINSKKLLICEKYAIGKTLPPHLSPFVEYKEGDYIPADNDGDNKFEGSDDEDMVHQLELEAEAKGISFSQFQEQKNKNPATSKKAKSSQIEKAATTTKLAGKKRPIKEIEEQQEIKELAKIMMSKKQKSLYSKIQYGKRKQEEKVANLKSKKQEIVLQQKNSKNLKNSKNKKQK
ncbi:9829_t:CDS:2 [Entrophospora sp. SA101]|nr:9829_t:CDS:2 [Entrophospora sp. SA101]